MQHPRNRGPLGLPKLNGHAAAACTWCGQPHAVKLLCDPAALRLAQLAEAGPAGEAYVPPGMTAQVLGGGDRVVRQFVVNAAVTEVAGVPRATLILTGTDIEGHTLPRWVVVDEDQVVLALAGLMTERAQVAVDGARAARGEQPAAAPPHPARAGYDQAVATLVDVAERTGSAAARWAADYLAMDPDQLAPPAGG